MAVVGFARSCRAKAADEIRTSPTTSSRAQFNGVLLNKNDLPDGHVADRSGGDAYALGCRERMAKSSARLTRYLTIPGNPAVIGLHARRPVALRPRLSTGMPLSVARSIPAGWIMVNAVSATSNA